MLSTMFQLPPLLHWVVNQGFKLMNIFPNLFYLITFSSLIGSLSNIFQVDQELLQMLFFLRNVQLSSDLANWKK